VEQTKRVFKGTTPSNEEEPPLADKQQTSSSPASLAEKKRKNGLKAFSRRTDGRSG